jgi:aldehyde dehydrogenase (NAD(P)+)
VNAAKDALVHPSWKKLPATERGVLMGRLADLMEKNKELFATIDAWDNGTVPLGSAATWSVC